MAVDPIVLDPEVEGILRELAADPRSTLLRTPRPTSIRPLFDEAAARSSVEAGRTAAERELLDVWRARVAFHLREASLLRLFEEPETETYIGREGPRGELIETADPERLEADARDARDDDSLDVESLHGLELVVRCVQGAGDDRPSAAQLAAASLRLVPHDSARSYVAQELLMRDESRTALRVLQNILAGAPSPYMRSIAWENSGWALSNLDDHAGAAQAYEVAAQLGPARSVPHLSWLFKAVLLGRTDDARRAARLVEEINGSGHPSVESWFSGIRGRRRAGRWSPSAESRTVRSALESSAGPLTQRLLDVFG